MKNLVLLSCDEIAKGGGVYRYLLTKDGKLERQAYLPCDSPMFAAENSGKLHVILRAPFASKAQSKEEEKHSGYFYCNSDFSGVSEIKSTLGVVACHLCVDGSDSYIVNYLSGNIVKNCSISRLHDGVGVNLPRQDMPHTHFAAFSPNKKYVLCCDLGLDTIFVYDRNLNELARAKVPDGYGVRHFIFSDDGKFIYAVNELKPSVSVFDYNNGQPIYLSTHDLPYSDKNSTAAAIKSDVGENKLYVSVRGENKVFVFDVNGEKLQLKSSFSCGGDSPRDIEIIGNYVLCANENTDNVTVIDKNTFKITDSVTLKHPLCILK